MDTDREVRDIFFNIERAMRFADPFFKVGTVGTILLLQFMMRMVKEQKLNETEFGNIHSFIKATDGKYDILNVPEMENLHVIQKDSRIQKLFGGKIKMEEKMLVVGEADTFTRIPELDAMGIRYSVMPDLNKGDGMMQIAVYQPDRDKFAAWYERYLVSNMKGGEKDFYNLRNLTSGRTSIVAFPLEGKEEQLREDFEVLHINYSVLPDLNVGDGDIQVVVANSDLPKVEHWYNLYKADMLKAGVEVKDMSVVSMDQYQATGRMTEQEYVNTANEELQKANEKYEGKEPGEIEKAVMGRAQTIRSEHHEAFERFQNDSRYIPVTINAESLSGEIIESTTDLGDGKMQFFTSIVPGSGRQLSLAVPLEQVFLTDKKEETGEMQTYICFLEKDKRALLSKVSKGQGGSVPVGVGEKMTGKELHDRYYDKVDRDFRKMEYAKEKTGRSKEAGKDAAEKAVEKAPMPPLKVRL